jgi:EAL domain-containing protein (putative c-di-GMP-specific phosphodiesterase class I)
MFANNENMEIIKTIISLAHNLGLDLIVEGLELSEQLAHIKGLKCHYGQGFLFSKPMEVKTIDNMLASGKPFFGSL